MGPSQTERRTKRSDDVQKALELKFAATAQRAKLSAIALSDAFGCLIASAGNSELNRQIAVLSPRLASNNRSWKGKVRTAHGSKQLAVSVIHSNWGSFYLSATDGNGEAVVDALANSEHEVHRILEALA